MDAGDLETALAFYSPDYFDHDRSEARAAGDTHRAALEHAFRAFSAAFSDIRHRIDDLLADGDRVAARISVEARHTGEVFGIPPTGRVIRNDSLVIYRFQQGLLRERWCRERHSTRSLLLETEAAS